MQVNKLNAQQKVLIELFKEFDRICKENKITYMLFAGTALGAIRHQGIIPWDDDLDVIMLREDYEKFLRIAPSQIDNEKYYVQSEFSKHWPMFFSKLRKNNTTFLERFYPKDNQMHQGVYIDIFPCDNLSNHSFIQKLQFMASKIVITKSLDKRGYLTDSFCKKMFLFFSRILPLQPFLNIVKMKNSNTNYVHTFFAASHAYEKNIFPRKWFEEKEEVLFCGIKTYVSKYYHEMLTKLYGDYMTLPSEEDRKCKVHGEVVDLDRSYEEYLDIQKKLNFNEYTRSIR